MRTFAYYLPQFHPIPENDAWWGDGFTEWTNVTRARPQFAGHDQPRLPADLGFYDLRLPEAMAAQAELALAHGLSGFTCWHYWFSGKRLLGRPVDNVLADASLEFPFNLAWANEPWSRRWLGQEKAVLQPQEYSEADDREHARWLVSVFADHRYTKVGDRPLFGIYNPSAMPDPARTVETIRDAVASVGLPDPYLAAINGRDGRADFASFGFDAVIDFEPQLGSLPYALYDGFGRRRLVQNLRRGAASGRLKVYSDREARRLMASGRPANVTHRSVFVGFDNTARRGRDAIVIRPGPERSFADAVVEAAAWTVAERRADEQLLWINAWNEWAEGNYLEPDARTGHARLEALKGALDAFVV
jgi:lipopolysaccharide biosynthesis protein